MSDQKKNNWTTRPESSLYKDLILRSSPAFVNLDKRGTLRLDQNTTDKSYRFVDKDGNIIYANSRFQPKGVNRMFTLDKIDNSGKLISKDYANYLTSKNKPAFTTTNQETKEEVVVNNKPNSTGKKAAVVSNKNNNFKSAFDTARNAGQGTFTFNGKLYSTLQKGESLNDFRRKHTDLDDYYNNLANGDNLGGWKQPSNDKMKSLMTFNLRDVDTTRTTPADLIETKSTIQTPTALSAFTKNDIRSLGFNNYNGLINAVNNSANANNPFVKSLITRYGSDTSKWTQANIEKDLNVKGKYRSFGGGDFGDMSRSMADWTNNYNNSLTKKNSFKLKFNNALDIDKKQQGGQINMNEQQQMQQAFLQYLMEKTGAKSEQELEQVIQKLGEDGLKQAYQQFVQEIQQQQVQAAKFGAKLNYIKKLNGVCPEGTELRYYKVGGRLCKKCMQMEKKGGPVKEENPVDKFKCGKKVKKDGNGCKIKGKWMPK